MNFKIKVLERFDKFTMKEFLEFYHVTRDLYQNFDLNKILNTGEILEFNINEKIDYIPEISEIEVLYEDEHLLIINKPKNILIYPDNEHMTHTISNYVAYYYFQKKYFSRVRYCHRLDFETTGILVFAKNFLVHSYLNYLWQNKEIKRTYLAISINQFKNKEGKISEKIARDRHNSQKQRVSKTGKIAITNYKVVKEFKKEKLSLVELKLETGRTHQIRVHLSHINHPLLGDSLYNEKSKLIDRCALHSYKLEMIHPITFENLVVTCKMPKDMEKVVGEYHE